MKKFMALAMAGVMTAAMVGSAFAATTTGSLWSASDTFEYGTFTSSSTWTGAWLQVELEEGEELASITLTVTTDEVVAATDDDGNAMEVLRYFVITDGTEYNIYSDGENTTYSVTHTADELADLASAGFVQAFTFDDGSNAGYGFNVQLGQSAGSVTLTYTLADNEMTDGSADSTFAGQSVAVSSDGSFVLTVDTTGVFTTAEDEYAHAWFQTYGADITVTKVTIVVGGEEIDVTSYAVLDGSDFNYMTYILDSDVDSYFSDSSTLDTVTAINYYVTAASTDFDNNWIGGAVGYQCNATGWYSAGLWTSSSADIDYEYYLVLSDESSDDDDTLLGDASGDGEINYLDAMAVLRYDAELTDLSAAQLAAADVNDDGLVNSLDAILILRYDAGLIESFE